MHSTNWDPTIGLLRKQIAPDAKALSLLVCSGKAVMKINGIAGALPRKWPWSSKPDMPGMWTSATMQDVVFTCDDSRKSLADANVCTEYPSDLTSVRIPLRTDTSSSMTEITGI